MADNTAFTHYDFKTRFGTDVTNNSDSQHCTYLTGTKKVFNTDGILCL